MALLGKLKSMVQTATLAVYKPLTPTEMRSLGKLLKFITNHWTAGSWTWLSDHYHFCVVYDEKTGKSHLVQVRSLRSVGSHTSMRNTGNVGFSLCGMGVNPKTKQVYKIQPSQIEVLAKANAEMVFLFGPRNSNDLLQGLSLQLNSIHDHAYWATKDGYGPGSGHRETRIDIAGFQPVVEKKAAWYLGELLAGRQQVEHLVGVK